MKVGDYVRFDYHRITVPIMIAKITEEHSGNEDEGIFYVTDTNLVIDESNLVKPPSPNIIDLIEDGDYVNGYLIEDKTIFGNLGLTHWMLKTPTGYLNEKNIYTIVTKEQFKNMEYKIGDDKE